MRGVHQPSDGSPPACAHGQWTEQGEDRALLGSRDRHARGYLTEAERALAGEGRGEVAIWFRTALLDGMRAEAVAAVEALTGRQVAAYLTAHEHDPDLAIIAFHFAPAAGTL